MQRVCARATESDNQVWLIVIIVSGFVMWCFNKSLPVLPFAPLRRAEISFVYLLITFRRDHAVFDADHAVPDIQVIVPRRRIQFRKLVDGVEVPSGRCSFDCLYFCWRLGLPRDVVFLT